jgi:hypothetical protein
MRCKKGEERTWNTCVVQLRGPVFQQRRSSLSVRMGLVMITLRPIWHCTGGEGTMIGPLNNGEAKVASMIKECEVVLVEWSSSARKH